MRTGATVSATLKQSAHPSRLHRNNRPLSTRKGMCWESGSIPGPRNPEELASEQPFDLVVERAEDASIVFMASSPWQVTLDDRRGMAQRGDHIAVNRSGAGWLESRYCVRSSPWTSGATGMVSREPTVSWRGCNPGLTLSMSPTRTP